MVADKVIGLVSLLYDIADDCIISPLKSYTTDLDEIRTYQSNKSKYRAWTNHLPLSIARGAYVGIMSNLAIAYTTKGYVSWSDVGWGALVGAVADPLLVGAEVVAYHKHEEESA